MVIINNTNYLDDVIRVVVVVVVVVEIFMLKVSLLGL